MKTSILFVLMVILMAPSAWTQDSDKSIPKGLYQRNDAMSADVAEEQSNVGETTPSTLNVVMSSPGSIHFKLRIVAGRNGASCSVEGRGIFDGTSFVATAKSCNVYLTRVLNQIFITSSGSGCSQFCGNAELETEFPIN
ncbi:MAG: hypothetical protein ABL958_01775 [Bdellovibrionia bacterium]